MMGLSNEVKVNGILGWRSFMADKGDTMVGDEAEVMAVCALCPNPNCEAVVLGHWQPRQGESEVWDFVCSRCGVEFSRREEELIYRFAPLEIPSDEPQIVG
jgi:hypothetical protein